MPYLLADRSRFERKGPNAARSIADFRATSEAPGNPRVVRARIDFDGVNFMAPKQLNCEVHTISRSVAEVGSDTVTPERGNEAGGADVPAAAMPVVASKPHDSTGECLEDLIGQVSAGDRAAFRKLYDQTARLVFGVVLRIVRNREIAEEVVQECYVLLWQRADRYQTSRGSGLAWIASIARYRAIDRVRADRARGLDNTVSSDLEDKDVMDRIAHSDQPCSAQLSDSDRPIVDSMSLRTALQRLKPDHQRAIVLAYRYGYTHEELACVMNVPLGTAKSWVRRGLKALKDGLES